MRRLIYVVLCCGVAACSAPFPAYRPLALGSAAQVLEQRLPKLPQSSKLTVRAVLSLSSMQLPLTLRVLRRAPGDLRILAMDDLGGTQFELLRTGASSGVYKRNPALPQALLAQGLLPDLATWLFLGQDRPTPVSTRKHGIGLLLRNGSDQVLLFRSEGSPDYDRLARGRDGTLAAEYELGWQDGQPKVARITNHEFGYGLELDVAEWQSPPLSDRFFVAPRTSATPNPGR